MVIVRQILTLTTFEYQKYWEMLLNLNILNQVLLCTRKKPVPFVNQCTTSSLRKLDSTQEYAFGNQRATGTQKTLLNKALNINKLVRHGFSITGSNHEIPRTVITIMSSLKDNPKYDKNNHHERTKYFYRQIILTFEKNLMMQK